MHSRLTLLNDMAGDDFIASLDVQRGWGITDLDLRMQIFGHSINELPLRDAERAAQAITEHGMTVHAFSTGFLVGEIAEGPEVSRSSYERVIDGVIAAAAVLRPRYVRILGGQWKQRPGLSSLVTELRDAHPWVFAEYRRVADLIADAGFTPIIENEATDCFLSDPQDYRDFMEVLDHSALRLTWDVQNQWATGVYPQVEHLDLLEPWLSYVHLKGARSGERPLVAEWNCSLEDSDYPVVEIASTVVARGLSDVICLNPTQHGRDLPDYDYDTVPARDVEFLRRSVVGID